MKKFVFTIIFITLLLGVWQTVQATELLLKYPEIEETTPTSEGLPGLIKYIYLFALGAAGFVALLAILIGAIMYVFSAGNPQKASDAKNRILSALLGILILLASVLILRTINPDLINIGFTLPEIKESFPEHFKSSCHCFFTEGSPESVFKGCFSANKCRDKCEDICKEAIAFECYVNATECN